MVQVNDTRVGAEADLESVWEFIRVNLPGVKVAVRDMDAFMHLLRIRDGHESRAEDVEIISRE